MNTESQYESFRNALALLTITLDHVQRNDSNSPIVDEFLDIAYDCVNLDLDQKIVYPDALKDLMKLLYSMSCLMAIILRNPQPNMTPEEILGNMGQALHRISS